MCEKWNIRFLELAKYISQWSKDPSTKVGAVIAEDNRIISVGYNGFSRGVEDLDQRYQDRETKLKLTIHAEENAILFANQPLKHATIYVYPFLPCSSCAAKIIQVGIKHVISTDYIPEAWKSSFDLTLEQFKEAGINCFTYPKERFENVDC